MSETVSTPVEKKKTVVSYLMKNNVLVTSQLLGKLDDTTYLDKMHDLTTAGVHACVLRQELGLVCTPPEKAAPKAVIIHDYEAQGRKSTVTDFVSYFRTRLRAISRMLASRQELSQVTSVSRLSGLGARQRVALIGFVSNKIETKNGNIMIDLEDETGTVRVLFNKTREELFKQARDLQLDEIVGVVGQTGDGIVFSNIIIHPDIPISHEIKKSTEEGYMAVISDLHIGSDKFLPDALEKFVKWTRGEIGTEKHRQIASKLKYLIIAGDVVDGVGIYPDMDKELTIQDVYEQFKAFTEYIKQIPSHIRIVITTGNHEPVRIAEPQPKIPQQYIKELYDLPHVSIVSNPATLIIDKTPDFPGFEVLLYHGFSYSYYGDRVDSVRESGRNISDRVTIIMKYLLQRRHLAPCYESTQFAVYPDKDPLMIETVPDFFISGHIHKSGVLNYRGVTLISGSCFQDKTEYMEKLGNEPDPGRVPLVNLRTRHVSILNFHTPGENHARS